MRFCAFFLALSTTAFAADPPKPASAPLTPEETVRRATLPPGFRMTVFAAEPDVVQPIAFTIDDRGRLWVVEGLSYPTWITDGKPGRDRVIILEDTDGDGRHDKRTVFLDNGTNLSGIELGFGGVWLTSCPNLIFVPDANGDDKPDGPPKILLDGWDLKAKHNVVNGLHWGPDGWLYGLNGILSNSKLGKPGTPDDQRTFMNCGVWRYHPVRHVFEVVAHGTTNPWGMDWDAHGRLFITNCVIEHVFHIIPGGHYKRMFGQDAMPHSYELLQSCADHIHWGGGRWTDSRGGQGIHDTAGGGHAHVGCMIYQGDNWPEKYRGGLFTCNLHGGRVNHDTIEPKGSGVVVEHGEDFLKIPDPWFRGLEMKYGPDGAVYLTDWCDDGECHDYTEQDINRQNGRIYRITYGTPTHVPENLAELEDYLLVQLQGSPLGFKSRHARRILQERAASRKIDGEAIKRLHNQMANAGAGPAMLQNVWTAHVIGELRAPDSHSLLDGDDEVAAWCVRLELEDQTASAEFLEKATKVAADQTRQSLVRLELAAGLQRLPIEQRWGIVEALLSHSDDDADPNIELMLWYGIEPLVAADRARALKLLSSSRIPLTRRMIARRAVSLDGELNTRDNVSAVVGLLSQVSDASMQADILLGILEAYEGKRSVEPPAEWNGLLPKLKANADTVVRSKKMRAINRDLRTDATRLAVLFGDRDAIAELFGTLKDPAANRTLRELALNTLLPRRDPALEPTLQSLLDDAAIRGPAIRALAAYDDPRTTGLLVAVYPKCPDSEKQDVINTLATRPRYAEALLAAVESEKIPARDLSTFTVRQIAGLKQPQLTAKLEKLWGTIRPTAGDKAALIAQHRSQLSEEALKKADRAHGRLVYSKICANCHKLFGEGRDVGPDLTGSQRRNVEYLLENLLDPNAVVGRDYRATIVTTVDGRVITGVVKQENDNAVTLLTANDQVVVPKEDIDERKQQDISLMPEGQLQKLTADEIRDLFAYLVGDGLPAP